MIVFNLLLTMVWYTNGTSQYRQVFDIARAPSSELATLAWNSRRKKAFTAGYLHAKSQPCTIFVDPVQPMFSISQHWKIKRNRRRRNMGQNKSQRRSLRHGCESVRTYLKNVEKETCVVWQFQGEEPLFLDAFVSGFENDLIVPRIPWARIGLCELDVVDVND